MTKISIAAAGRIAKELGLTQIIITGWDGAETCVTTWGKTIVDCDQAAQGGNVIKRAIGFPEELCHSAPARIRRKQAKENPVK